MSDLISICIPTYRRPSQLLHALHSCLIQDYRPLEIDIGDDSPTSDSERLVGSLLVPDGITLRYRRNHPSLGQNANVNSLFERARGQRLVLLHDDDTLAAGAVTLLNDGFTRSDDVVAAYGCQEIMSESGEVDASKSLELNRRYRRTAEYEGIRRDTVLSALWRQFPNDGFLVDGQYAKRVGYRTFEEIGDGCDADFAIRLGFQSRGRAFVFINAITCQYRLSRFALSAAREANWRLFDYLLRLNDLSDQESSARDSLLSEIAVRALVENAVHGRRDAARAILRSKYYPGKRRFGKLKSVYHRLLILVPQLDSVIRQRIAGR